jgi:outer membrane protein OmpA-like peptidoglycan-associated protein
LILNYNLFRGGADRADVQKHITKINQEVDIQRELKRQVIEGLDLSWDAYEMIGKQIVDLKEYQQFSEKTLELYKEEYNMGRRSLLDLLASQNDLINARTQMTGAKFDLLFAKYRILDAMGTMVNTIVANTDDFQSKVNLSDKHERKVVREKVNLKIEEDKDSVKDRVDLCDNSVLGDYTQPYGCLKRAKKEIVKPVVKVVTVAKPVEEPKPTKDNPIVKDLMLNFKTNSSQILKSSYHKVIEFAQFLKEYSEYKAAIYGHTDSIGSERFNLKLSTSRAKSVRNALIKEGVKASRLEAHGSGEFEPIADNNTNEGRSANRRIEAKLFY